MLDALLAVLRGSNFQSAWTTPPPPPSPHPEATTSPPPGAAPAQPAAVPPTAPAATAVPSVGPRAVAVPSERPDAVVAMPSESRPALVRSLAEGVASGLGLPLLGSLERTHDRPLGGFNSARRVRALHDAFRVPSTLAEAIEGKPVLLVDDHTNTGWTLTVAAALVRTAGATGVYPVTLATGAS